MDSKDNHRAQIRGYAVSSIFVDKKAVLENTAMHKMTNDLVFGDWIFSIWEEYEKQESVEAKFVKALDKIEGFLHIAEVGVENYILPEFRADYCEKAVSAFDEISNNFPNLKDDDEKTGGNQPVV